MRISWRRAIVLRLLVLLFGTGQAALPALASVIDSSLAAQAGPPDRSAHAEDGRQASCRIVHPHECVLCASLLVLAAPSRAELHEGDRSDDPAEFVRAGGPGQSPCAPAGLPRAPPTV